MMLPVRKAGVPAADVNFGNIVKEAEILKIVKTKIVSNRLGLVIKIFFANCLKERLVIFIRVVLYYRVNDLSRTKSMFFIRGFFDDYYREHIPAQDKPPILTTKLLLNIECILSSIACLRNKNEAKLVY